MQPEGYYERREMEYWAAIERLALEAIQEPTYCTKPQVQSSLIDSINECTGEVDDA